MSTPPDSPPSEPFPRSRAVVGAARWDVWTARCPRCPGSEEFFQALAGQDWEPVFLADLARLEWALGRLSGAPAPEPFQPADEIRVNPSLTLLHLAWKGLPAFFTSDAPPPPQKGEEFVAIYRHPETGAALARRAADADLLALKIALGEISPKEAAAQGHVPVALVEQMLAESAERGLVLVPASKIRRTPGMFPIPPGTDEHFIVAPVFTLQWHVTQDCDLHCRHCYDREARAPLPFPEALRVLEDLYDFCKARHVRGQVSFSGGNPMLHPRFIDLYRAAADLGFGLAILGNPVSREEIEALIAIETPLFYQVSLEGLRPHNDFIRQPGHFDRVMDFLDLLRELRVYSMVMLTLTSANTDEVLPLADLLRDKADLFTFNRLSAVGEGAALSLPAPERYARFMRSYLDACHGNPVMALKDNLFNPLLHEKGMALFGGCAGYGCGAAFNFMALLPDGEVHACRKFPSPIGHILHGGMAAAYESRAAAQYRAGPAACRGCAVRPVCGGCLAVTHATGLDIFNDRDPFCTSQGGPIPGRPPVQAGEGF